MGNCESTGKPKPNPTPNPPKSVDLYKLMKGGSYFNEQNTINFSRKDLENTLSDQSILNIMHGGGEKLKHYPKRDRYSKYETQQIKNNNQNLWGGHQLSTVSDQEMQTLRNLITQNGGCGSGTPQLHQDGGCGCGSPQLHQVGGCGCGENSVLNGGFNNNANIIANNNLNGSATSSFMQNTVADLSATSYNSVGGSAKNGSATSSFMPNTVADLSATSVSVNNAGQRGGLSATSTLHNSESNQSIQLGGITSSTSEFARSDKNLHYNPELQQYQTNQYQTNNNFANNNLVNNNDSAMERLINLVGNNIQMGGFVNDLSTSSQPVKYEKLIESGWGKKSKKQKGGAKSSSSSVTSSSSSSGSSSTGSSERRDKSETRTSVLLGRTESETEKQESVKSSPSESSPTESSSTTEESTAGNMSRGKSIGTQSSQSPRSRASSTSSSGSTPSSQSFGGSSSSSSASTFSSSSSRSKSPNSRTVSVKRNIYLSTTASEGNVIDAKQFYSSDQGELYSSETNYLRHNLTKRRFR